MEEKYSNTGVSLGSLFLTFAKIGVMTFGGGLAMIPILTREVVETRCWATEKELTDYYAISQCTPGIIAVNTATFIGQKHRGLVGGIIATLGVVFPSLVIICALAGVISAFSDNIYVQKAFLGIRVCVCVLIANAIIKLWKSSIKSRLVFILFLVACAVSIGFNISPVIIILISATIGVICAAANANIKGVMDE